MAAQLDASSTTTSEAQFDASTSASAEGRLSASTSVTTEAHFSASVTASMRNLLTEPFGFATKLQDTAANLHESAADHLGYFADCQDATIEFLGSSVAFPGSSTTLEHLSG
ncbi:hypothetical protein ILYODFUR_018060 [Ilyodon furcidens]|uniref:Uncharacterized protein n=1 Tax=Ilyodon furcidens TaxID=33524 RepID=A0ABV0TJK5_9TELE